MRDITHDAGVLLSERGVLRDFAFIAFIAGLPGSSLEKQWSHDDYSRLHDWEEDIISKIMSSSFRSFWPVMPVAGKKAAYISCLRCISEYVAGRSSSC